MAAVLRADLLTQAFLAMRSAAAHPSDLYIGALLRCAGRPPELADLQAHIARFLPALPSLTHRITDGTDGPVRWEPDPHFALDAHVTSLPEESVDAAPIRAWLREPDPERPLWHAFLLPGPSGSDEWGLAYVVHHAAQDGTALVHTLKALFGGSSLDTAAAGRHLRQPRRRQLLGLLPALLAAWRDTAPLSVVAAPPTQQRRLFQATASVADLQAIARATGATFGQAHLAALAGAVRAWSAADFTRPDGHGRDVRVMVPLDTRVPGEDCVPGNLIGMFLLALPTSAADPSARLRLATRRLARGKVARRRSALRALAEDVPARYAAAVLGRLGGRRRAVFTASTLRPIPPLQVLGHRVTSVVAIPFLPPGANCFCLLNTYGDQATIAVLTDSSVGAEDDLAACWAREIAELRAAVENRTDRQGKP